MIGLVSPRVKSQLSSHNDTRSSEPPIYNAGCAGRITSFKETADGKMLITLTGYSRFSIIKDIPTLRGYRRFEVSWDGFEDDWQINPNPDIDRDALMASIKEYCSLFSMDVDWLALEQAPNFTLVTFFSMSLPFSDEERQTLLTAQDVSSRAILLDALIHRAIERKKQSSS
jgi:Lon protease-like protein